MSGIARGRLRRVFGVSLLCLAAACASGHEGEQSSSHHVAGDCDALTRVNFSGGATVESVQRIQASERFDATDSPVLKFSANKAFCRVKLRLQPSNGSSIRTEVWLPVASEWNGKFMVAGNGGFGGTLTGPNAYMNLALAQGFASAGTDMGHVAQGEVDAAWAHGQPDRLVDWSYRAVHATTEAGKQLVDAFYGKAPNRSYFQGCSDGGREALMAAVRYPNDFDGIIAGAPAYGWTELMTVFGHNARVASAPGASLSTRDLALITSKVLQKCDSLDGLSDGIVEGPGCRFDPDELRCGSANQGECLTPPQVEAVRAIYAGPRRRDGESIWPGFAPGSEGGWNEWITGPTALQPRFAQEFFRWMVYGDADWTVGQFNSEVDHEVAEARVGSIVNASNPDLSSFLRRGKLLMFTGTLDPAVPPQSTIDQYERIIRNSGPTAAENTQLFVIAGMAHCMGGTGPNVIDTLSTLDRWVDTGAAPTEMSATKYDNDLFAILGLPVKKISTRPVCAWPSRPRWDGTGQITEATSFSCQSQR